MKARTLSLVWLMLSLLLINSAIFTGHVVKAQSNRDSLLEVARTANSDTTRIDAWLRLARTTKDTTEPLAFLDSANRIVQRVPDKYWQAAVMLEEAEIMSNRRRSDLAMNLVEDALNILENKPNSRLLGRAYGLAGQLAWSERSAGESINYKKKWVEFLKENASADQYGKALNNLGVTYKNASLEVKALESLLKALEIAEQYRDSSLIGSILNNIGNVYKNREEYNSALDVHWRAIEIRKKIGEPQAIADSYNNLGLVFRKMGESDSAMMHFQSSIKIRKPTGERRRLSYAYNNIGLLFLDKSEIDSALYYFHVSLQLKENHGDPRDLALAYLNIGEAHLKGNQINKAIENFEKTGEIISGKGYVDIEIGRLEGLSSAYAKQGKFETAYGIIIEHNLLKDSLNLVNLTKNVRDVQATIQLEQSQNEINRLEQDQRVKELELQNAELARNTLLMALLAIIIIAVMLVLRSRSIHQLNVNLQEANATLQATRVSKEEKETLLKEIHHRVKNNLQIITSLLRLQSENIKDPEVLAQFNESQNRIRSMALVHEELYRSDDFTNINMQAYFSKLSNDLIQNYAVGKDIKAQIHTEVDRMGVNTLIPLGLMVNEIITNALKHAFDGPSGNLAISLRPLGEKNYELIVSDDGKGFPDGFENKELHSLGVELIYTLAEQLDGSVQMDNQSGARYIIRFQCQD